MLAPIEIFKGGITIARDLQKWADNEGVDTHDLMLLLGVSQRVIGKNLATPELFDVSQELDATIHLYSDNLKAN